MKKSAFGLYVLHYPVMLALARAATEAGNLEAIFRYAVVFICGTGLTFVLAEIIKRIPIIRFFVLGIKKPR